jgi:hypothetical protein
MRTVSAGFSAVRFLADRLSANRFLLTAVSLIVAYA